MESVTWLENIVYMVIFYHSYRLLYFVGKTIYSFVLPKFGFVYDLRRYGEWAVVTGSTDGIGKNMLFSWLSEAFQLS